MSLQSFARYQTTPGANRRPRTVYPGTFRLLWSGLMILCAAADLSSQPGHGESPGDPGFPWGQTFKEWRVQKSANILRQVPGEQVLVQKNDLVFEFSFHLKKKVKDVRTETKVEEGKEKVVFRELLIEPAEPPEQGRLYAVGVRYPRLPLNDELRESLKKMGATSIPDTDQFNIELASTLIQVTFSRYKDKRYLEKIVFISKEVSGLRTRDEDLLKKEADDRIKRAIREKELEIPKPVSSSPWMRSEIEPRKQSSPEATLEVLSNTTQ
ncbi:MAG: hypothetical protein JNM27_05765 [Leptospirales bacterium]|nr:hypothetical protein [Leptospirales bacterium]